MALYSAVEAIVRCRRDRYGLGGVVCDSDLVAACHAVWHAGIVWHHGCGFCELGVFGVVVSAARGESFVFFTGASVRWSFWCLGRAGVVAHLATLGVSLGAVVVESMGATGGVADCRMVRCLRGIVFADLL